MNRERILVGGMPGSGKSTGWLSIARLLPKSTFHIIDPDDSTARLVQSEFSELRNLQIYFTPTWFKPLKKADEICGNKVWTGGITEATSQIRKQAKPGEWVVLEMMNNLWSMAQGAFVERVFKEGIGEYFLKVREALGAKGGRLEALRGWSDWTVINRMHNDDFITPLCFETGCHIYMTTSVSLISPGEASSESRADPETASFYGDSLIRLEGQKYNPYRAQSIFLFSRRNVKGKDPEFRVNTFLKDRGRKWLQDEPLWDFGIQYLTGVAGWQV